MCGTSIHRLGCRNRVLQKTAPHQRWRAAKAPGNLEAFHRRSTPSSHVSVPGIAPDFHLILKLYGVPVVSLETRSPRCESTTPQAHSGHARSETTRSSRLSGQLGKRESWAPVSWSFPQMPFTRLRRLHPHSSHSPLLWSPPSPRILTPPATRFQLHHVSSINPPPSDQPRPSAASTCDCRSHPNDTHPRPPSRSYFPIPGIANPGRYPGKEGRRPGGVPGSVAPPPDSPDPTTCTDPGSAPPRARGSEVPSPTHRPPQHSTSSGAGPRAS